MHKYTMQHTTYNAKHQPHTPHTPHTPYLNDRPGRGSTQVRHNIRQQPVPTEGRQGAGGRQVPSKGHQRRLECSGDGGTVTRRCWCCYQGQCLMQEGLGASGLVPQGQGDTTGARPQEEGGGEGEGRQHAVPASKAREGRPGTAGLQGGGGVTGRAMGAPR